MDYKVIYLGRWTIEFFFCRDGYEVDPILDCLYDADAPDDILVSAYHLMEDNRQDTGFTFSNQELKRIVVVIGPTESGDEFINTFVHEIQHVAVAIASELGVKLDSEVPAYVAGDASMDLAHYLCRHGCDRCN